MAASDALTRFETAAARLGVEVAAIRFPEDTRTADQAAVAIGCDVAQIVKSLVFATGDGPIVALTSGANRVDLGALGAVCGSVVERADADAVRVATGFAIGGTPPFGHVRKLPTYLDRDLRDHETVWAAAGLPDSVFPIDPETLQVVAEAVVADFAERPPKT